MFSEFKGDSYFPKIDMLKWKEVDRSKHKIDDENKYDLEFIIYERIK